MRKTTKKITKKTLNRIHLTPILNSCLIVDKWTFNKRRETFVIHLGGVLLEALNKKKSKKRNKNQKNIDSDEIRTHASEENSFLGCRLNHSAKSATNQNLLLSHYKPLFQKKTKSSQLEFHFEPMVFYFTPCGSTFVLKLI